MNEEVRASIIADLVLMTVFLAIGVYFWMRVFSALGSLLPGGPPILYAIAFIVTLNFLAFLLGKSRHDDSLPNVEGGMTGSVSDFAFIVAYLVKVVTISPSVHFRQAYDAWKGHAAIRRFGKH